MAEGLLRHALGPAVHVESAGMNAVEGRPAEPEALRLMADRGIDITAHRGRQWTQAMALAADLILVMDKGQKDACERLLPSAKGRVFLLGHWLDSREIGDPFRQGPDAWHTALEAITESVAGWLQRMIPAQRST